MEKMNQMPSMILQSIYMEVAREHSSKSPVNSIYKDKTRTSDFQTETIFSEASSVSQVNTLYSNNETPTRADLMTYTTTIEEEDDSSDGFETLEKLTQKSDFHLQIGNQNTPSRGKSPINTPNTPELTRSPSTSLYQTPQISKSKPAIKIPSNFKQNKLIENSSNKLFERAMSLPVHTANPVAQPKRVPQQVRNEDASPEDEKDDDPFGYDDSLKDFYNNNNKNKKRTSKASSKKDLKVGPSRNNKEFNRSSSLSSKKSHFFYLSNSFSENEPPGKSKFNDKTYTPRLFDNSFQEGKQRNFHTEGNESQRSPVAGSKRESFLKDLESADKHLNTPHSHNSFEENELLAKSSSLKESPLRPSKKKLTLTIDPEAEALENLPTNSDKKTPVSRISPTKEQPKSNLLLQYPSKQKTPTTKSLKDSPKSPKYLKQFKVPLDSLNKQKESPTVSPRFEKNRPPILDQNKPTANVLSKTPKSLKSVDLYGGGATKPPTPNSNAKVINSTKASPKALVDPRDRCRFEGQGSAAAKEKLSIYSQKKNVPELKLTKPPSVPFNSQRSNQSNMIDSKSSKITYSPILKSKIPEFFSSGSSPDKSLSKVGTESENPKDSESFIEDTKHLDRMISQASLEGITKEAYDLDPDLFEPFMNKNEAIERINTPSRIYMKIIDKILEEDSNCSSTIVQESTKNTNTNTLSTPKEFYKPGHSPQSSKSRHTPVESLYTTKKMSPYNARPQSPQLFDKSGGHTPKKSSDKAPTPKSDNSSPGSKLPNFGGATAKSPSHANRQISKSGPEIKKNELLNKYSSSGKDNNKIAKKPNPTQLYSKMSKNPPRTLEILTLMTEPSQGSPNYLKRDFRSNNLSPTPKSDLPDSEIPSMHSLYRQFGSLTPTNVGSNPQTLTTIGRQSPTKNLNLYNNKTPTPKHNAANNNRIRTEPDFEKSPKTTNTKPGFSSGRITPKGMSSISGEIIKPSPKSYENKSQFGKNERVSESLQQHLTDTLNDFQQAKKDVKIYQYRSLTGNLFNKIKGT